MTKLQGLQSLRGVAANLVVLFHCFAIGLLPKYGLESSFQSWSFLKNTWAGVDLFFCISGFILFYTYSNSAISIRSFFIARVIRIVPMYWFCTGGLFACQYFLTKNADFAALIRSLSFSVNLGLAYPVLAVGWTLQYEMLFYLVFGICLIKTKKFLFASISLIFLCIIILEPGMIILAEFMLGGFAYLIYRTKKYLRFQNWLFLIAILTFVFSALFINDEIAHDYRIILFGIPSSFLVVGFANLCMPRYSFQVVGNYSYSLYLIHFPLISIFFKFFAYFDLTEVPAWLVMSMIIILCNFVAYIIWRYFELPVTNFLKDKFRS